MPGHEFLFALQLSDEPHFDAMLGEVAGAVLAHVGYSKAAADELRGVIRRALSAGLANGNRRCDVRFSAQGGELHVVVVYDGGAEWRTTRPLP